MKIIKTLLIFSLVIALSFSLLGCKLLPWGDSAVEETTTIAALPGWLTLAYRAEAAEEPEVDEEEKETAEAPAQTAATQPATTQPATTQSAQTEQPAQSSGTPKYLQPGTMEYLAKINLDMAAVDYERLKARSTNPDYKEDHDDIKAQMRLMLLSMQAIAKEIGLDLQKEYGLSPAAASGGSPGDFWHEAEGSGWDGGW
jgi:hypothetical protein